MGELKILLVFVIGFALFYFMPLDNATFFNAVMEAFYVLQDYAREHVVFCLIPAFFIAGGIAVFLKKDAVMKFLGPKAPKPVAYGVASVSGAILAVCSCTVLPLFSGIYKMGAGLGPAATFLYSGPAINVLAVIMTARVLGPELGIVRGVAAVFFSIVIGICMHFLFLKEEKERHQSNEAMFKQHSEGKPIYQTIIMFLLMIVILVFANWAKPQTDSGVWSGIFASKWIVTSIAAFFMLIGVNRWYGMSVYYIVLNIVGVVLVRYLSDNNMLAFITGIAGLSIGLYKSQNDDAKTWLNETWEYAKIIIPLLFYGVIIAGFLLGRPGYEGIIPSEWVYKAVGGNSLWANFFASIAGAFMYFATLTEVPILQGLIGNGMGKGPALALLLAGPALSLPNMLVIKSVLGFKKTFAFVSLVVVMATIAGIIYGAV
ncbi:MAG: permease [Candidatus Muirbacterium halophilum]|nr:permease [Candidatus Muirbacterium halophilum]MCK9474320.1 permease [Candidatus Muirbacterium halophilum]